MVYSNTAVDGGINTYMVNLITCLFSLFLKHLMMLLKCNFFQGFNLHLIEDTDIMFGRSDF